MLGSEEINKNWYAYKEWHVAWTTNEKYEHQKLWKDKWQSQGATVTEGISYSEWITFTYGSHRISGAGYKFMNHAMLVSKNLPIETAYTWLQKECWDCVPNSTRSYSNVVPGKMSGFPKNAQFQVMYWSFLQRKTEYSNEIYNGICSGCNFCSPLIKKEVRPLVALNKAKSKDKSVHIHI